MNTTIQILSSILLLLSFQHHIPHLHKSIISVADAAPISSSSFTTNNISQNKNNEKYDRSISTFSPDGRLLQVEYSTVASNRGNVMVIAFELDLSSCGGNNSSGGGDAICVAVLKDDDNNEEQENNPPPKTLSSIQLKEDETQTQLIHRISPTTLLFATGLKGDGRILASALRYNAINAKIQHGEEMTVQEISQACSKIQHELTWTGGARPLGVTATLVGVDWNAAAGAGVPKLYQIQPGGVIHPYDYCVAGGRNDALRNDILDGLASLHEYMEKQIQLHVSSRREKEEDNNDLTVEKEDNHSFRQHLLEEIVQKLGTVVLNAASSSSSFLSSSNNNSDSNKHRSSQKINLWVVQSPTTSSLQETTHGIGESGGAFIRYATDVTKDDLTFVSKQMFS
uniref:Proteasome alpha-type subunits domain-containing protein n=1 Tax=Ditylum brightwellii TaxID=49249 RepID=A0A6V2HB13_9STRA